MRKFTSKNQKDWDEYLTQVREPLDVLREVWTEEDIKKTTVVTHLVQMRERLEEMTGLVRAKSTAEESLR